MQRGVLLTTPMKKMCLLLMLASVLGSCRKTAVSEFKIYRFIDHQTEENVILSPLRGQPSPAEERDLLYPLRSFPLMEAGIGSNPLEVKRKLKLGGTEFNVLFSPPDSTYSFNLDIPENSVMDFGIGIVRDKNSEMREQDAEKEKGVNFMVVLKAKGRKKTVFQRYCEPPPNEEERTVTFSNYSVELPGVKSGQLELITEGGRQNFSFWFNPVLYQKERNDRNVILISVDTVRADHLGCYGYGRETSPNIDSLASDSALFSNVYASSPWTLPSHVAMLTSLHGVHHQVYHDDEKMDPALLTLAEVLRQNHYFCSAFTGGGFVSGVYGFSKGFDSYREGDGGVFSQNSAETLYGIVAEWLDQNARNKNHFLFLHTYQPHDPYACPEPFRSMFLTENAPWRHINLLGHLGGRPNIFRALSEEERQNAISLYDSEIRYTDEKLIGPLIRKIKEMELYDKTLIVFTSDHGEEFYDHLSWGHGHQLYDESLKVPLIIKFPGSQYRKQRLENIVSLVDVMPTILEEAGIDASGLHLDGRSLMPILQGKERGDRTILADIGANVLNSHIPQKIATNQDRAKFILNKKFSDEDLAFFQHPPPQTGPVELYGLDEDPKEKRNAAHDNPTLVNRLIRFIEDLYGKAQKRRSLRPEIDEALKEQLRALGYIQ